jgi:hypothetical protein
MKYATQAVEVGHHMNGADDPYWQFGEITDLHPVYAAMALAREVAEANGTEPAEFPGIPPGPIWRSTTTNTGMI